MKNNFRFIVITVFMLPLSLLSMESTSENNHAICAVSSNKRKRTTFDLPYEPQYSNDENDQLLFLKSLLSSNPPIPSECPFENKLTFYSLQPEHLEQETSQGPFEESQDIPKDLAHDEEALLVSLLAVINDVPQVSQQITQPSTNHPTISSKKSHICPVCNKAFTSSSNLKKHERTHSGEKPFKCTTCDKSFAQSSDLKNHERTHSGEKPFKCPTCNKAFTHLSTLKNHERIHTGEKPFKCPTCGKTFTQANNLKNHERIHNGEKPFKCDICDKAFTRLANLKNHEKTHTGNKPFKCDICDKTFTRIDSLKEHKKTISHRRKILENKTRG